jgi:hypothetical protein
MAIYWWLACVKRQMLTKPSAPHISQREKLKRYIPFAGAIKVNALGSRAALKKIRPVP